MRYITFFISILSILFFSGCSKYDDLENQLDSLGEMSALAIFNTVPNSLNMEVYLEGKKVKLANEKLSFGGYLPYKYQFAGKKKIKIVSYYRGGEDSYEGVVDLQAGKVYSLFVNKDYKLNIVQSEDNIIKPKPGYAKIRLAHMSYDAASLSLNEEGGKQLFKNIKYKDVTGFVEIKSSSSLSLLVRPIGLNRMPQLDQNFKPEDQGIYTLLVRGYIDPNNEDEAISMKLIEH